MKSWKISFVFVWLGVFSITSQASAMADSDSELLAIQQTWAHIKYQLPKSERRDAFESLLAKTEAFQSMFPDQVDAMLWSAVVLYNYAGEVGGIKALGMVKKSWRMLQRVKKTDPTASHGLIHVVLGQLYYKVPGWPIAFGDEAKAEQHLRRGLALNSDSLDANYFMGDYLLRKKQYHLAVIHLHRAIQAPVRINRPIADAGRKADALQLLHQAEAHGLDVLP